MPVVLSKCVTASFSPFIPRTPASGTLSPNLNLGTMQPNYLTLDVPLNLGMLATPAIPTNFMYSLVRGLRWLYAQAVSPSLN